MYRDTPLSSGSLFHFTQKKENLKHIIKSGFKPNFSLEQISFSFVDELTEKEAQLMGPETMRRWFDAKRDRQANPHLYLAMVSFCDIPLKLSKPHRLIYGNYAIGLSKHWAENIIALNPIIYMANNSNLRSYFSTLWTRIPLVDENYFYRSKDYTVHGEYGKKLRERDLENAEFQVRNYHKILEMCREIVYYVKPYAGPFCYGQYENQNHRFYDEREWRYIPPFDKDSTNCLETNVPNNLRDYYYKKLQSLAVDLPSVTHIIVNTQEEVQEFKDYVSELQASLCQTCDLSGMKIIAVET